MKDTTQFKILVNNIININESAGIAAKCAVNQLMTLRNWAIGYYIVEYEQNGNDKAEYGENLLGNLERKIAQKGMNTTLFKLCRQFYIKYPQIGATASNQFITAPEILINNLSFSHIKELLTINDSFERCFYETECIKCNWSVRELRRQIKTNLLLGLELAINLSC